MRRGLLRALLMLCLALSGAAGYTAGIVQDARGQIRRAEVFHILLRDAALAQSLHRQLSAAPAGARFALFKRLARQHSIDTGSAATGGDLGLIWDGEMVRPFEDAVFAATPGEVGPPVKSEFGWHLIYISAFRHEPVGQFCDNALRRAMTKADAGDRPLLEMSLRVRDREELQPEVSKALGPAWSEPMQDDKANLLYFSKAPVTLDSGLRVLQLHIDYVYPWIRVSPTVGACTRSRRERWLLDCQARTIGVSASTDFEGRAASGAVVHHAQFSAMSLQLDVPLHPVRPDTFGGQLLAQGCDAAQDTGPQIVLPPLGMDEEGPTEAIFPPAR